MEKFGDLIKKKRLEKNLSLRQLADKILKEDGGKISRPYLYDIENNVRIPSPHIIVQLAKELGYSPEDLLALANRMAPDTERYVIDNPVIGRLLREAKDANVDWSKMESKLKRLFKGKDEDNKR